MDTLDFAAQELGVGREELAEALRRGRIRAERDARRRNDGAVAYQAVTPEWALAQSIQAGYVSRLVFELSEPKPWHWRVHGPGLSSVKDGFTEAVELAERWDATGKPVVVQPSNKLGLHL